MTVQQIEEQRERVIAAIAALRVERELLRRMVEEAHARRLVAQGATR